MNLDNRTLDMTPLSSPDAAYREVLREDAEYYPLDDNVALLTLRADLERMLTGKDQRRAA
jgi:hypothetical protein